MKKLWCWRCKAEMPMLDEVEFAEIAALYSAAMQSAKEIRKETGVAIQHRSVQERFEPVRAKYQSITGFYEPNHNAILHHRISLYGPPCAKCGKPLRSPKAKICGSCMHPVNGA